MIQSFRHKGLRRLFEEGDRSRLPAEMVDRIRTILSLLDAASALKDFDRPSFKLHRLKGNMEGFWAVTVRANWRIIFRFSERDVHEVDFMDYH